MEHPKTLDQLLTQIPNVEEQYIKEQRRKINKANKDRARRMEIRVAKYLNGERVPMSGSGMMKGDIRVQSPYGLVLIECKYSARTKADGSSAFIFLNGWLEKLQKEVLYTTRAAFGILVFHFHERKQDFVVVPESVWFGTMLNQPMIDDDVYVSSRGSYEFVYDRLNAQLNEMLYVRYECKYGVYIITLLPRLKALFDEVE